MVVPVYEGEMAGVYYNTAAVIDADGTYLGKYRKKHIPQIEGLLGEVLLHARQPRLPDVPTPRSRTIGVYICYDRHFPEGARALGLNGAEIVFNPSATVARPVASTCGSSSSRRTRWPTATTSARSTASAPRRRGTSASSTAQCYFVDPRGKFVGDRERRQGRAGRRATSTSTLIQEVRHSWQFFRDRRPDAYGECVTVGRICVVGADTSYWRML